MRGVKAASVPALAAATFLSVLLAGACNPPPQKVEVLAEAAGDEAAIRVACSDECYTLFQRIVDQYSSRRGLRFEIIPMHSSDVLGVLERGAVDAGVTSLHLSGPGGMQTFSYVPFAYDGAVFFASADARVSRLTASQVDRILSGEIGNWKDVGGADRPIRIIGRPASSSTSLALGLSFYGGKLPGEFPAGRNVFLMDTAESGFQAMKTLKSYLAYAPMSRTMVESFPAVPLTVDGLSPLLSSVPSRKYPAKLEYGILFRKEAPAAVAALADFLVSVDGMHQLASLGAAPTSGKLALSSCHCRETEGTFAPPDKSALAGLFTIAVVPERGAIEQERRYGGVSQVIADELGVRTRLKHLDSYEGVIDEFREGRIDAAFVNSFVYGRLRDEMGIVPIARPQIKGNSFYRGLLVTRADSAVRQFADLRGKTFAYVPSTSSSELFARTLTAWAGNDPGRFFGRLVKVSSHAEAISLVKAGKVDGAAVKNLVFDRMFPESSPGRKRFRVLAMSPPFPESCLVVTPAMDDNQKRRLREILLTCGDGENGKKALEALGAERFIPTTDEDYEKMYAMVRDIDYRFGKR